MTHALRYLHDLCNQHPSLDMPSILLLQELTVIDLDIIQRAKWTGKNLQIMEVSFKGWQVHYGTIILVDRRLRTASVFRVHHASNAGRDALFVDKEDMPHFIRRFWNTMLESRGAALEACASQTL